MSIPNRASVITLDYSLAGRPFVPITSRDTDTPPDTSLAGRPFFAAPAAAAVVITYKRAVVFCVSV